MKLNGFVVACKLKLVLSTVAKKMFSFLKFIFKAAAIVVFTEVNHFWHHVHT